MYCELFKPEPSNHNWSNAIRTKAHLKSALHLDRIKCGLQDYGSGISKPGKAPGMQQLVAQLSSRCLDGMFLAALAVEKPETPCKFSKLQPMI